jgi:post-segregation antitoxin (ccd killing protein)
MALLIPPGDHANRLCRGPGRSGVSRCSRRAGSDVVPGCPVHPRLLVCPVIPWYSSGMTAKRKVSVSLDEDLVAELEAADEALSGQVNEAIRAEVERRRRNRLLTDMLDSLDAKYGPVDEALVAKYTELL